MQAVTVIALSDSVIFMMPWYSPVSINLERAILSQALFMA